VSHGISFADGDAGPKGSVYDSKKEVDIEKVTEYYEIGSITPPKGGKMKKVLLAIVLSLLMLVLIVSPATAAKPQPYFNCRLTSDGVRIPGAIQGNFIFKTDGVPSDARHTLGLTDIKTNLSLADGDYPFSLQATPDQIIILKAYFAAKGWPDAYLTQIGLEINGASPFFYLSVTSGSFTLVDGFMYAIGGVSVPLTIDNDYPAGSYVYTGTLGTLPVTVTLKVTRDDFPIPVLVSPLKGAVMDNGRLDHLDSVIWDFDWQDFPGATLYNLYVINADAIHPMININVADSVFNFIGSGYIIDANRLGWTWKVRAQVNGVWGAWSEIRIFNVEPVNTDPPGP
jgi:hypothetical protein